MILRYIWCSKNCITYEDLMYNINQDFETHKTPFTDIVANTYYLKVQGIIIKLYDNELGEYYKTIIPKNLYSKYKTKKLINDVYDNSVIKLISSINSLYLLDDEVIEYIKNIIRR